MPEAPVKDAVASLSYDLGLDMASERLSIEQAEADFNGIRLSLSGTVRDYRQQPKLNLHAALPRTAIADVSRALPEALMKPVTGMKPGGHLSADVDLAGSPEQVQFLVQKGTITLDAVELTSGSLPITIDGQVHLKGDTAWADAIAFQFADAPAVFDFKAEDLMTFPIRVTHTLSARKLDIDKLLAAGSEKGPSPGPGTPSERPARGASEKPRSTGPIDLPVTVNGTVRVTDAIYNGLPIRNFVLLYLLENNILTVNQIRGDVAGGTITGTGKADLNRKDITYAADMAIEGTQTDPIVAALYPRAANTLFGNLFLKFNMNGQGLDLDTIARSLTGNADVRITDGRLTGTGLTKGLAAYLDTKRLEVLRFNSIRGDMRLVNGKIRIDSEYAGNDLRMAPKGSIGLDGSLDLSLNLQLAPELAARIDGDELMARLLKNQKGWAVIPLNVAGSVSAPRFALDTALVKQMLQEKAGQALQERLMEKLFKPSRPKQDTKSDEKPADTQPPPVDRMLEEGLKKLID